MLNVVLLEPEIPANTGNIGRTCVATGSMLHLIGPLGFQINEKQLRRAGMDYWPRLNYRLYRSLDEFWAKNPSAEAKMLFATTKAHKNYADTVYEQDSWIMFGKESAGIPEEVLVEHESQCIRIPMLEDIRSLNLSNSVAIVVYEALRQRHFAGMQNCGALHHLVWKSSGTDSGV
ncbi:MAG: tRNA (cytidine(34)-2'-O)-methyltransferase [Lachnospiraceae bacterium]